MREIDEYLERKGAKYFVTLLMVFYVVGTVIFNLYLATLGIFEFELLKLRYMFMGFTFSLITVLPVFIFLGSRNLHWKYKHPKKKRTKRQQKIFQKRFEQVVFMLLIPWAAIYSWNIFPNIPSGFGGAKPIVARLIGTQYKIQQINETIAFETGVPYEKLPFEQLTQKSDSAVGANVLILDRNKDRIFLLLTKDLYLSSTSNLAKNLLESGKKSEQIQTDETKNFKLIPLIVDAKGVLTTTTNLYEPPKILTQEDIRVAAAAISSNDEATSTLASEIITQQSPQTAPKILAAVQQIKQNNPVTPSKGTSIKNPISTQSQPDPVASQEIEKLFEESFDEIFLDFRAAIFNEAVRLQSSERRNGIDTSARNQLVQTITNTFERDFASDWAQLKTDPYLITGKTEKNFSRKITSVFQGAESATELIERINATEPDPVAKAPVQIDSTAFDQVQPGALEILEKSFQEDSDVNRKYVSRVLSDYFNSKARNHYQYWNETKYLYSGREDEGFIQKMTIALETATDWESFGAQLTALQQTYEESLIVPEPEPEITPEPEAVPEEKQTEPETAPEPTPTAEAPQEDPSNPENLGSDNDPIAAPVEEETPQTEEPTPETTSDEPTPEETLPEEETPEVTPEETPSS